MHTQPDDSEERLAIPPIIAPVGNTEPLSKTPRIGAGGTLASPSSRHGGRKKRTSQRQPSAKSAPFPSSSEQENSEHEPEAEPVQVTPSFLFVVNRQDLNENPDQGGIPPDQSIDQSGRWSPPVYAAGFGQQSAGTIYRWRDGQVSRATDTASSIGLRPWKSVTMFYCNPFNQFVVTEGDVRSRNLPDCPPPQDRWYPLGFHHIDTVSHLDFAAEYTYLAGNRAGFIHRIGLDSYTNRQDDAPRAGGLAGNLAMLIALIAFSCRGGDLDAVLIDDRAWRHCQWRGHQRRDGRRDSRGLFVSVYLDPRNPYGSTEDVLHEVEWNQGALLS
ncbi:hypothetical protein N431DRAFT_355435 [Stipitochalara longipes BDJ]|nr:hypothetical protein N431DRAFT_355435 [Stipitochalara longipes BDJ]